MVLVVEDEHGLVVAYAIWERWGAAGDYWKGQKTIHPLELDHKRKAFPATLPLATPVIPLVPHVDPDMDAQWRAHTYACHSTITANFGGAYTECYYLHRLVSVSPVPGAGTMLVQWGVDRAKGEGVVWGCESTAGAFGFYRRFGARGVQGGEIGGWVVRSVLAPDVPATIVDVADEAAPTAEGEAEG
ncbi:hypothetical protein PLICRDRAFT_186349 [Plicaturopsis crispa FD-325 SS-3]|nr:hypothetical protein PLICRDRAFT_186349 [Plicaturopsis crispa FD-325 SS-3]